MNIEEFKILLNADKENEHLEFKEAKSAFSFDSGRHSICGYCVALANERGGKLILGVREGMPRIAVGTRAFLNIAELKKDIFNFWKRRVVVEEFLYEGKRILILTIPSRPIAEAIEFRGQYLMRIDDRLESMTSDEIRKISNESVNDYSAEVVDGVTWEDLSPEAIKELRRRLHESDRVKIDIDNLDDEQLLKDLQLIKDSGFTRASLVLLGKESTLKTFLPHAEVRFGYKINENEIRNQDRAIYCKGYLLFYDEIWQKINSRNIDLHIPSGMLLVNRKTFDEEAIREAINNAITHRDYSIAEEIFISQTQTKIAVKSPGGFLDGITIENIMDECKTRNKLIADVLDKCVLVEHFGNGVNLMIKKQLSLGKNFPDYTKSDKRHVSLELDGVIKDMEFAKYVLRVANKKQKELNDKELAILYKVKNNKKIKANEITESLLSVGLIERLGYGKYILSKQYYESIEKKGEYTRRRGLDKTTNKELIIKHLEHYRKGYMKEFIQVLKDIPQRTINTYLKELERDGKIMLKGNPRISRGVNKAFWCLK